MGKAKFSYIKLDNDIDIQIERPIHRTIRIKKPHLELRQFEEDYIVMKVKEIVANEQEKTARANMQKLERLCFG